MNVQTYGFADREDQIGYRVGRAEELRGEIAKTLHTLRRQLGELGQMNAHGPAYEYTKPAVPTLPEPYCHPRKVTAGRDPSELWEHVDEWLCSDWGKAAALDAERFWEEEE